MLDPLSSLDFHILSDRRIYRSSSSRLREIKPILESIFAAMDVVLNLGQGHPDIDALG